MAMRSCTATLTTRSTRFQFRDSYCFQITSAGCADATHVTCRLRLRCLDLCFGKRNPRPRRQSADDSRLYRRGCCSGRSKHDWNLGPTGLRGWIYCDRLVTPDARQIAITAVDNGSLRRKAIDQELGTRSLTSKRLNSVISPEVKFAN